MSLLARLRRRRDELEKELQHINYVLAPEEDRASAFFAFNNEPKKGKTRKVRAPIDGLVLEALADRSLTRREIRRAVREKGGDPTLTRMYGAIMRLKKAGKVEEGLDGLLYLAGKGLEVNSF